MEGLNVAFSGRLGADPESRYTKTGAEVLQASVCVDDSRNDVAVAEGKRDPTWVRLSALADRLEAHDRARLRKGALVYAEGKLEHGRWQGQDGQPRCGLNVWAFKLVPMGAGRMRDES